MRKPTPTFGLRGGLRGDVCRCAAALAACMWWHSPAGAQSSLEQVPVTGSDVAAELGLTMTKFKARFAEPVYCLVNLEIKAYASREAVEVAARSPEPRRTTEILFSIKDLEFMKRQLDLLGDEDSGSGGAGGAGGEEWVTPVAFSIKADTFATRHYVAKPFGDIAAGMSFYSWSPQHSTENLPLDVDIPVFLKAGPYLGSGAEEVRDILQEYVLAPAWVRMTVRFSREPLRTAGEIAAEQERRRHIEDVLARFDQLVEDAAAARQQPESPGTAPVDDKDAAPQEGRRQESPEHGASADPEVPGREACDGDEATATAGAGDADAQ